MDRRIGSLTRSTARLSASPFRMLQCSPRRSARWRSFATISNSVNSSLRSTRRSARCGQWLRPCRRHRKKNGGNHPAGSRPRSRATASRHFPRSQSDWQTRSGEYRDSHPCRSASCRGHHPDAVTAMGTTGCRSPYGALLVRSHRTLQGTARQDLSFGSRSSHDPASLLSLFYLLHRTTSR